MGVLRQAVVGAGQNQDTHVSNSDTGHTTRSRAGNQVARAHGSRTWRTCSLLRSSRTEPDTAASGRRHQDAFGCSTAWCRDAASRYRPLLCLLPARPHRSRRADCQGDVAGAGDDLTPAGRWHPCAALIVSPTAAHGLDTCRAGAEQLLDHVRARRSIHGGFRRRSRAVCHLHVRAGLRRDVRGAGRARVRTTQALFERLQSVDPAGDAPAGSPPPTSPSCTRASRSPSTGRRKAPSASSRTT